MFNVFDLLNSDFTPLGVHKYFCRSKGEGLLLPHKLTLANWGSPQIALTAVYRAAFGGQNEIFSIQKNQRNISHSTSPLGIVPCHFVNLPSLPPLKTVFS